MLYMLLCYNDLMVRNSLFSEQCFFSFISVSAMLRFDYFRKSSILIDYFNKPFSEKALKDISK